MYLHVICTNIRFPSSETQRLAWAKVTGLTSYSPSTSFVCERHFTRDDYSKNLPDSNVIRLKPTAIPSLYLPVYFSKISAINNLKLKVLIYRKLK